MEYRHDLREEFWHFCPQCSMWPPNGERFNVLWLDSPPDLLKLCPECLKLTSRVALADPSRLPARFYRQTKP